MEDEKLLAMKAYLMRPNAISAFEEFEKALTSRDNRQIENSKAIQLLDIVLSDASCPIRRTILEGDYLYRGRLVDFHNPLNGIHIENENGNEKYKGYDKYASKEPPIGSQNAGRCNTYGMPYLYLAEDEYTACAELKVLYRTIVSVASFRINKNLRIIDFSEDVRMPKKYRSLFEEYGFMPADMMTYLMGSFTMPVNCSDDYRAPQYITDRVRKNGYDGIAYQSFFSTKKNYAIFNCCSDSIVFVDSHLKLIESKGYQITSLDDLTITPSKKPDCDLNQIREHINAEITIKEEKERAENR